MSTIRLGDIPAEIIIQSVINQMLNTTTNLTQPPKKYMHPYQFLVVHEPTSTIIVKLQTVMATDCTHCNLLAARLIPKQYDLSEVKTYARPF